MTKKYQKVFMKFAKELVVSDKKYMEFIIKFIGETKNSAYVKAKE
jgi:hypothetical protein